MIYLWKHIELQKLKWKFGRMRAAVGTWANSQVFPQLFQVLANVPKFYTSVEHIFFLLHALENSATKKKTIHLLWSFKCQFSLLVSSLHQQSMLVLCFHQIKQHNFKPLTVYMCIFSVDYFLKWHSISSILFYGDQYYRNILTLNISHKIWSQKRHNKYSDHKCIISQCFPLASIKKWTEKQQFKTLQSLRAQTSSKH